MRDPNDPCLFCNAKESSLNFIGVSNRWVEYSQKTYGSYKFQQRIALKLDTLLSGNSLFCKRVFDHFHFCNEIGHLNQFF